MTQQFVILASNNHLCFPFPYCFLRFAHIRNPIHILQIQISFPDTSPSHILIRIKPHFCTRGMRRILILRLRTIRTIIVNLIHSSPITMRINNIRQCIQIVPSQLIAGLLIFKITIICMYGQSRAQSGISRIQCPVGIKL